ncbi:hypothetical protein CI109_105488 [Kwoniella shandongensis]|uniref:RING-type E3 ubiquitin transferase n=1 Tax=Kwoniella shandongensis TaxID=1734106 RepID=A0A5M6C2H0_9TREE|nr:uncharacterized protein CI109_002209 [Kwoniella shandongensis]KAA5529316.1 hypothetical protein CI109_002209 [Kwoniella shandongensis]
MADFSPSHFEEEGDVCRVCRVEGDEENPLIYPCKCSGSVRFVHPDCLKQWLAQSQKKYCEICGHKYTFTKVYPDQLPTSIPFTVYIRQSILWLYRQILWVARCWLVVIAWLIVLPGLNMFSLRGLLWLTDHLGLVGTSDEESAEVGFNGTIANATFAIMSNITDNSTGFNTTTGSAADPSLKVDGPVRTLYRVLVASVKRWVNGEDDTIVGFVLRGQVLSIALAAVLIGLILLREWITQHNWQEHERPPIREEGEINPDEWVIMHGVARRTVDVMAAIMGRARTPVGGNRRHRIDPDRILEHAQQAEGTANEAASPINLLAGMYEQHENVRFTGDGSDFDNVEMLRAELRLEAGEPEDADPESEIAFTHDQEGSPLPSNSNSLEAALAEYRRHHEIMSQVDQHAAELDMLDQPRPPTLREILQEQRRVSQGIEEENEENEAGPSRPTWSQAGSPTRSVDGELADGRSTVSQRERDDVAYAAPELLRRNGKGKAVDDDEEDGVIPVSNQAAGPSQVPEMPEALFLPPPDRTTEHTEIQWDPQIPWSVTPDSHFSDTSDPVAAVQEPIQQRRPPTPPLPRPNTPPAQRAADDDGDDDDHGGEWEDEVEADAAPPEQVRDGEGRFVEVEIMEEMEEEPWDRDDWNGVLEVIGLIGPIHGLFQNVLFGVIVMGAAISVLVGLPMIIGKLFLSIDFVRSTLSIGRRTLHLVRKVTDPIVDVFWEIVKEVLILPLLSSFRAAERIIARKVGLGRQPLPPARTNLFSKLTGLLTTSPPANVTLETSKSQIVMTKVADVLALVGQVAFDSYEVSLAFQHKIATSDRSQDRIWCMLSGYGVAGGVVALIALAGDAGFGSIPAEWARTLKQHGMFLKLAFFMLLELAAFPLGIGTMIDACTVPLFPGATLLGRYERLTTSPFGTLFANWLMGTLFMYQFATLLSHIRTLCRPGTLFFIRDPADPNYSPVKDIMEKSAFSQLRKLGTSAVMYGFIVFCLFGAASWGVAHQPFVNILPLRLDPTHGPLTSVPFDLIFLHLVLPPTLDLIRPRHRGKKALSLWWRYTTSLYRLDGLISTRRERAERDKVPAKWEFIWSILDPICRFLFGPYNPESITARVPASDQVALAPPSQRRAEGGVFIPLDDKGIPLNDKDKMRLLKQDRLAREAGRDPISDYEMIYLPKFWRTRVHVFIGSALAASSTVVALGGFAPLLVGRMAVGWKLGVVHDGYNWLAGAYIIYFSLALGLSARKRILAMNKAARLRRSDASTRVKRGLMRWLAGGYGVAMFYGLLPVQVGLVLETYLVMLRAPLGDGAGRIVIHFWDVWATGTIVCSLFMGLLAFIRPRGRLTFLDLIKERLRNPAAKHFATTNIVILPTIGVLAIPILLPICFGTGVLFFRTIALGGEVDEDFNATLFRSLLPLCFGILVATYGRGFMKQELDRVKQKMVDAEYVVEERVENYVPGSEPVAGPKATVGGKGADGLVAGGAGAGGRRLGDGVRVEGEGETETGEEDDEGWEDM